MQTSTHLKEELIPSQSCLNCASQVATSGDRNQLGARHKLRRWPRLIQIRVACTPCVTMSHASRHACSLKSIIIQQEQSVVGTSTLSRAQAYNDPNHNDTQMIIKSVYLRINLKTIAKDKGQKTIKATARLSIKELDNNGLTA